MSIPFSNTHYRIPQGFGNLLEGLTREILREQPDNIPAFAAAYFENLLEKREKTNFDPAEWGAKVDDRFYNNHAFNLQSTTATEAKEALPEKSAPEKETSPEPVKERETQVSFVETTNADEEETSAAAVKIQAAFRGHRARKEMKKMKEGSTEEEQ